MHNIKRMVRAVAGCMVSFISRVADSVFHYCFCGRFSDSYDEKIVCVLFLRFHINHVNVRNDRYLLDRCSSGFYALLLVMNSQTDIN